MISRTRGRELALQILFQQEFDAKSTLQESMTFFADHFGVENNVYLYAKQIITGLHDNSEAIDLVIQKFSTQWKISRMSLVDRNILRIALTEIMGFTETPIPPKVAISEAVDVAKKYGTTDSSAFTNGILDEALKSLGLKP